MRTFRSVDALLDDLIVQRDRALAKGRTQFAAGLETAIEQIEDSSIGSDWKTAKPLIAKIGGTS